MLASFLHCHSNTGTLNLTVCEFRRGGAYARDKNTSTRLWAKNAGGAYARRGAYLRDTTVFTTSGRLAPHNVIRGIPANNDITVSEN